jgi:DNA-binding protein YbaB
MFGQIKDLYNLKKQAEELQKQMANEKFTGTSGPVTITINGNQELIDVQINSLGNSDAAKLAKDFKAAFNQAQEQMKRIMADKFRGIV